MRAVRRLNPIYILIALNILLLVFRDFFLPEETSAAIAAAVESTMLALGIFGYAGIVVAYVLCSFFFVPVLIPLNILGGALYGPFNGTIVAIVGITLGTIATTISVRYVFTGMQASVEKRPSIKRLLAHADDHHNLVIIMIRFVVVIPYFWQNIALAVTKASVTRIAILTAFSAMPGAAIYSFLGAGLIRADQASEILLYVALPIVLLIILTFGFAYMRKKYEEP